MEEYLCEALKTDEPLKITTSKDKIIVVKIHKYDSDKVYYTFFKSNNEGSIMKSNIKDIKFNNSKKQKKFEQEQSRFYLPIHKFCQYYMEYLKNEDNENQVREKFFEEIFDALFNEDENNLLLKYFCGNQYDNKENNVEDLCLLLDKSNISQREAINNALNYKVSVVEGPPGTGKTTTILSMIANLITSGKKVVVVSKNNTAVNNIIEEFQKSDLPEFYVRFGRDSIMKDLQASFESKCQKLKAQLNKIPDVTDGIKKLKALKLRLNYLEREMNEMVDLRSLILELRTQKKFIDRRSAVYDFEKCLTPEQKEYICDRHATVSNINRVIKYANKKNYNFLEKIIAKYVIGLNCVSDKEKMNAIRCLLEELYLNNEIASKEGKLLKWNFDDKKKKTSAIYEEYTDLSLNYFKNYLKNNIIVGDFSLKEPNDLIDKAMKIFPLILTTADGFLYNFKYLIETGEKIDCIIIDEASQCDVLTALPLLFFTKKIIVVGDSKQLSAITNEYDNDSIPECYRVSDNNFLTTIKDVFNPPCKVLYEHYRCDYGIINFCNKYYYDSTLKIYNSMNKDSISIINADKYKGMECVGSSFANLREIKTMKTMSSLENDTFFITPFKGQANELKKEIDKDRCGTIHTFQGKGADVVYFSTVLNDFPAARNHIMGDHNLFYPELINVAVSRAKKQFVLVCDKCFFENNKKYVVDIKRLIDYIEIYGTEMEDKSTCIFDYLYKNIRYYRASRFFDNEYEEVLYRNIREILEDTDYMCYLKLKLTDLVQNRPFLDGNPEINKYIKNGAHADFTIMDKRIGKPVLVVELDGDDHKDPEQKKKDKMKGMALTAVDIPLVRVPSKVAYDIDDVEKVLFEVIGY